ncbi:MAG TPA: META domain-containing protein [Acidimicrobiia bacterium]
MRTIVRALAGLALVVAATACGGDDQAEITDRTWQVTELEGETPVDGTTLDMTITDDTVAGSSGCNTYNGAATVADDTISLGPNFAMTFMACEDPIMTQEQAYLDALTRAATFEVQGDTLTLFDDAGDALVVLE